MMLITRLCHLGLLMSRPHADARAGAAALLVPLVYAASFTSILEWCSVLVATESQGDTLGSASERVRADVA